MPRRQGGCIARVPLYGSFLCRDEFHDIDVGLLVSWEREPYELYKYAMGIASDLERCITPRYEIDLRILNDAPVEFQYEVVKTGRLLVARDEDTRVAFEAGVITKFLDLKYLYDRIDRALLCEGGRMRLFYHMRELSAGRCNPDLNLPLQRTFGG